MISTQSLETDFVPKQLSLFFDFFNALGTLKAFTVPFRLTENVAMLRTLESVNLKVSFPVRVFFPTDFFISKKRNNELVPKC